MGSKIVYTESTYEALIERIKAMLEKRGRYYNQKDWDAQVPNTPPKVGNTPREMNALGHLFQIPLFFEDFKGNFHKSDECISGKIVGYRYKGGYGIKDELPSGTVGYEFMGDYFKISDRDFKYDTLTEAESKPKKENKNDYAIYHNSYSDSISEVERYVDNLGFKLNQEELAVKVGFNSKRPRDGETNKFLFFVFNKDGSEAKKCIHVQVYGMGERYELNMYFGFVKANEYEYYENTATPEDKMNNVKRESTGAMNLANKIDSIDRDDLNRRFDMLTIFFIDRSNLSFAFGSNKKGYFIQMIDPEFEGKGYARQFKDLFDDTDIKELLELEGTLSSKPLN